MRSMASTDSRTRVILLGPPGAGKGTQAQSLRQRYGLAHISTGDMLRAEIAAGSERGRAAESLISQGQLVPDELLLPMLWARLEQADARAGFLLDGFPRTVGQAQALVAWSAERGDAPALVIQLEVEPESLVGRLSGRRTCSCCGASYHLTARPPQQPEVCDLDGGALLQRADDNELTIRQRLDVYSRQTRPVADYFAALGRLYRVDAAQAPSDVEAQIESVLRPQAQTAQLGA